MYYINCTKGVACGSVQLYDIKVRYHHGKRVLFAIWKYANRNCSKLNESLIRMSNGRMVFNSGSEHTVNIIPANLYKKYAYLLAK